MQAVRLPAGDGVIGLSVDPDFSSNTGVAEPFLNDFPSNSGLLALNLIVNQFILCL